MVNLVLSAPRMFLDKFVLSVLNVLKDKRQHCFESRYKGE